ncbi:MAG: exodeoxyribonuclease VII large subunit [Acidobacteriaceae bacterium]|nr:exodeoxyribonuclease VII large subunit [Acidobacteriaceae bacterium]
MLENREFRSSQLELSLEPERRVFSVADLNAAVQRLFDADFRNIFVAGEISGSKLAGSGHYYFCLKDANSQLNCVLFKGTARYLKFKPRDGLAVIARGNLEVYEFQGKYQLIVDSLEPQGAGALQIAFDRLKQKLAAEGLFDPSRKRPIPKLPRRIAIVTSPSGAVIRDILHVLARRFPGLHIRLFPSQVQGEGSVEQVCAGLAFFSANRWADVVIVARGGGSLEDLWTFNEESVARAVAASRAPVISAIGHETDFTICDFVADLRAPTPSAAAEMVICTRESLLQQIANERAKLLQAARYRILRSSRDLHQKGTDRAGTLMHRVLTRSEQRLDDLESRAQRAGQRIRDKLRGRVSQLAQRLQAADLRLRFARDRRRQEMLDQRLAQTGRALLWTRQRRHEALQLRLAQLSPLTVLSRGYAIVQAADGHALRSSSETQPGDRVLIRLHSGELDAVVEDRRA